MFEVTPEKKLVWTYTGRTGLTRFQVLTTNGEAIADVWNIGFCYHWAESFVRDETPPLESTVADR